MRKRDWFVTWKDRRFGLQTNTIFIQGEPYMDRWIFYVGGLNLRLHRFWRGDEIRASHSHPWTWFITFPFASYREDRYSKGIRIEANALVTAFNFHKRGSQFEHIVLGRADWKKKPFWTFVIAGGREKEWGFYPNPLVFVPWREWK